MTEPQRLKRPVQRTRRPTGATPAAPVAESAFAAAVVPVSGVAVRRQAEPVAPTVGARTGEPVLRRAFGDDFNWAGAGSIKRSGDGAEGVLFVTAPGGQIVVKFLKEAAGADQADTTLRATGVAVPDSRVVRNSDADPLGAQIRALVTSKLDTLTDAQKTQVQNQMATYGYIQLQEKSAGTALDKLDANGVQGFLQNAGLLQEVGKIAAIDSFLGNTDRLSRSTVNTGNYMLTNGASGPTLVAIDNEMHAKVQSKKAAREGEVRFVMSNEGVNSLASAFLVRLTGGGTKYMFTAQDEAFVKDNIQRGIEAGARAIADLMADQPGFIDAAKAKEVSAMPGPQGTGTKQRTIVRATLKARVQAMQDQYVKGGWARLAPALAD